MHSLGVAHRDLKPDNFMVLDGVVKVLDFGLACLVTSGQEDMKSLDGVCGTAGFMAPEMLAEKEYDFSVDIWAIGVILYCLFYGEFPFSTEDQQGLFGWALAAARKRVLMSSTEPAVFRNSKCIPIVLSDPAVELLQSMLVRDPTGRVTADKALTSQYMSEAYLPFKDAELSSLLPMFELAREARLFHKDELTEDHRLDPLLERQNKKYAGLGLVDSHAVERTMSTPRSNVSPSPRSVTPSTEEASPRLLRGKSNLSTKSKASSGFWRADTGSFGSPCRGVPDYYTPLRGPVLGVSKMRSAKLQDNTNIIFKSAKGDAIGLAFSP